MTKKGSKAGIITGPFEETTEKVKLRRARNYIVAMSYIPIGGLKVKESPSRHNKPLKIGDHFPIGGLKVKESPSRHNKPLKIGDHFMVNGFRGQQIVRVVHVEKAPKEQPFDRAYYDIS